MHDEEGNQHKVCSIIDIFNVALSRLQYSVYTSTLKKATLIKCTPLILFHIE